MDPTENISDDLIFIGQENIKIPTLKPFQIRKDFLEMAVKSLKEERKTPADTGSLLNNNLNDTADFRDAPKIKKSKLKLKNSTSSSTNAEPVSKDTLLKDKDTLSLHSNTNLHVNNIPVSSLSLDKNDCSEKDMKKFCSICSSNIDKSEFENHVLNCMILKFSKNTESGKVQTVTCQICQKNLTHMNSQRQAQHINQCADKVEAVKENERKHQAQLESARNAVLGCPMCGKKLKTPASRQSHLKKCAALNKMSVEVVKNMVRQQEEELHAKLDAGILPDEFLPKTKKAESRTSKAKSKIPDDEQLQLAMALSKSMAEDIDCLDTIAQESLDAVNSKKSDSTAQCKGKKVKHPVVTSLLLSLTREQAQERITQRVDRYIFSGISECSVTNTPSFKTKPAGSKSLDSFGQKDMWSISSLDVPGASQQNSYYVHKLMPPICISHVETGSKLKRVSIIPGRRKSTDGVIAGKETLNLDDQNTTSSQTLEILKDLAMQNETDESVVEKVSSNTMAVEKIMPCSSNSAQIKEEDNSSGFYPELSKNGEAHDNMSITTAYLGLVNSPNFSDVSILTKGDRKLHAHKVILHARCSRLLHMMQNFEGASVIDLSQYQEDTVLSILKYIYADCVDVSPLTVSEVVTTSTMLGLEKLGSAALSYCLKLEVNDGKDACNEEDESGSDSDWYDVYHSQRSKLTSATCGPALAQVETSSAADSDSVLHDTNVCLDVGDIIGKENVDADSCQYAPSNADRQEQNNKKSSETIQDQDFHVTPVVYPCVTSVELESHPISDPVYPHETPVEHEPHPVSDPINLSCLNDNSIKDSKLIYSDRCEEAVVPGAQPHVCYIQHESPDEIATDSTSKSAHPIRCLVHHADNIHSTFSTDIDTTAKPIEGSKILDFKMEDIYSPVRNNDVSSDLLDPEIMACLEKQVSCVVEDCDNLDSLFKTGTRKPLPLHMNNNNQHLSNASNILCNDNTIGSNISSNDDTKASNALGYEKPDLSGANNIADTSKPLKRKRKKKVTSKVVQAIISKVISALPSTGDDQPNMSELLTTEDLENITIKIEQDFNSICKSSDASDRFFIPSILDKFDDNSDEIAITFADIKPSRWKGRKVVRGEKSSVSSTEKKQILSSSKLAPAICGNVSHDANLTVIDIGNVTNSQLQNTASNELKPVLAVDFSSISQEIDRQLTDANIYSHLQILKSPPLGIMNKSKTRVSTPLENSIPTSLSSTTSKIGTVLPMSANSLASKHGTVMEVQDYHSDEELFSDDDTASPRPIFTSPLQLKSTSDAHWTLSTLPVSSSPHQVTASKGHQSKETIAVIPSSTPVERCVKERMFNIISDVVIDHIMSQSHVKSSPNVNWSNIQGNTIHEKRSQMVPSISTSQPGNITQVVPSISMSQPRSITQTSHNDKIFDRHITSQTTKTQTSPVKSFSPLIESKTKSVDSKQSHSFYPNTHSIRNSDHTLKECHSVGNKFKDKIITHSFNNHATLTRMDVPANRESDMAYLKMNITCTNSGTEKTKSDNELDGKSPTSVSVYEDSDIINIVDDSFEELNKLPVLKSSSQSFKTSEILSLKPSIYLTKDENRTSNSLFLHNVSQTSPTPQDPKVPKSQITTPIASTNRAATHVDISGSSILATSPQKSQTRRGLAKKGSPILLSSTLNDRTKLSHSDSWLTSPIPSCSPSPIVSAEKTCDDSDHLQVERRLDNLADCLLTEHALPKGLSAMKSSKLLESLVPTEKTMQSPVKMLSPDLMHRMSNNLTKIYSSFSKRHKEDLDEVSFLQPLAKYTQRLHKNTQPLAKNIQPLAKNTQPLQATVARDKTPPERENRLLNFMIEVEEASPLPLRQRLGLPLLFDNPQPDPIKPVVTGKEAVAVVDLSSSEDEFDDEFNLSEIETAATALAINSNENISKQPKQVLHVKTPVRKKKNTKLPSPFTPMPPYDSMSTPDLKAAASKIGVRPVGKKRLRELMKHVYHSTHQYETDSDYDGTPVKQPRTTVQKESITKAGVKACTQINKADSLASSVDLVQPDLAEEDNVLTASQDSSYSDGPDVPEESILQGWPDEDMDPQSQANSETFAQKFAQFILENKDIYNNVLMYEPLELDVLKKRLTECGIKVGQEKIMDFLDERCITFTLKNINKGHNRNRRKPGPKKITLRPQENA